MAFHNGKARVLQVADDLCQELLEHYQEKEEVDPDPSEQDWLFFHGLCGPLFQDLHDSFHFTPSQLGRLTNVPHGRDQDHLQVHLCYFEDSEEICEVTSRPCHFLIGVAEGFETDRPQAPAKEGFLIPS